MLEINASFFSRKNDQKTPKRETLSKKSKKSVSFLLSFVEFVFPLNFDVFCLFQIFLNFKLIELLKRVVGFFDLLRYFKCFQYEMKYFLFHYTSKKIGQFRKEIGISFPRQTDRINQWSCPPNRYKMILRQLQVDPSIHASIASGVRAKSRIYKSRHINTVVYRGRFVP